VGTKVHDGQVVAKGRRTSELKLHQEQTRCLSKVAMSLLGPATTSYIEGVFSQAKAAELQKSSSRTKCDSLSLRTFISVNEGWIIPQQGSTRFLHLLQPSDLDNDYNDNDEDSLLINLPAKRPLDN